MATSIRLAPAVEQRLDFLAARTGRTKAYYLRTIIENGLSDMEDYYLAQIALEVRRTKAKNPAALKLKHMLIQFASKTKKSTQETLQASKNYWMGLVDHKQRDD